MERSIHSHINSAESPQTLAALLPFLAPQQPRLRLGACVQLCPPHLVPGFSMVLIWMWIAGSRKPPTLQVKRAKLEGF